MLLRGPLVVEAADPLGRPDPFCSPVSEKPRLLAVRSGRPGKAVTVYEVVSHSLQNTLSLGHNWEEKWAIHDEPGSPILLLRACLRTLVQEFFSYAK